MANMVWAFAKAGVAARTLFEAIAVQALRRLQEFNSQELAKTVWAFATARVGAERLFQAIAGVALMMGIRELNSQELVTTIWAFATVDVAARTLFEAIAVEAVRRIDELNPQELAITVWAFATARVAAEPLFEAIAVEASRLILRLIRQFNPQDLANMVWAFATAGVAARSLFHAIAAETLGRVGEFNSQNLANAVWAFARAGIEDEALFEAIAMEALRRSREFTASDMATTIWAFACIGWEQNEIFRELGSALMDLFDDLNNADKSQLYLVTLYVEMEWPDLDFPLKSQLQSLRSVYTQKRSDPSLFQRDVSVMLTEMGWNHEFEHVTEEGISLAMADPEAKRAVQISCHYNGAMRFKARLLRGLGWHITRVTFRKWHDRSVPERRHLLKDHLAKINVVKILDEQVSLRTQRPVHRRRRPRRRS